RPLEQARTLLGCRAVDDVWVSEDVVEQSSASALANDVLREVLLAPGRRKQERERLRPHRDEGACRPAAPPWGRDSIRRAGPVTAGSGLGGWRNGSARRDRSCRASRGCSGDAVRPS